MAPKWNVKDVVLNIKDVKAAVLMAPKWNVKANKKIDDELARKY